MTPTKIIMCKKEGPSVAGDLTTGLLELVGGVWSSPSSSLESEFCKYQRTRQEYAKLEAVMGGLKLNMNTFGRDLELATLGDLDSLLGLVAGKLLDVLDLVDDLVTLEDLSEDNMASIEPTKDS